MKEKEEIKKELLKEITEVEIKFDDILNRRYGDDKYKKVAYWDYIIHEMPEGFMDEYGKIINYDIYLLNTYKEIIEEEIDVLEEVIYEIEKENEKIDKYLKQFTED